MKKFILYHIIFGFIILASCSDFLKEYSQFDSYIEETSDLDEILAGDCYLLSQSRTSGFYEFEPDFSAYAVKNMLTFIHVMDDDIMENIKDYNSQLVRNSTNPYAELYHFYRWSEVPFQNFLNNKKEDPYWKEFYYRIAVLNAVLAGADELEEKGKSITEISRIRGEALFLRAWNYFMLCNIYGMPYDKKNPSDPYGVPLKIAPEVQDTDFKRSTVGQVYDQVVSDLEKSIENFNKSNPKLIKDLYSADINASYAFLSRVYLYMEEYEKAIEMADKVTGAVMEDLNNKIVHEFNFSTIDSKETIFNQGTSVIYMLHNGEGVDMEVSKGVIIDPITGDLVPVTEWVKNDFTHQYAVSTELANMFNEDDLRYKIFFNRGGVTGNLFCRKYRIFTCAPEYDPVNNEEVKDYRVGLPASGCCWIRYAEVLLNKMEAQACLGDVAGAHTTLSDFLTKRYKILPTVPSSGMELIKFIRDERRKELCFEGHRWFDIRRYAVSTFEEKIEVEHKCFDLVQDADGTNFIRNVGTRKLTAYDESTKGKWSIPIPAYVIEDNHNAISNPSRENGVESNIN